MDTVLYSAAADVKHNVRAVVQGFAGRVELSTVRTACGWQDEVCEEFPELEPADARRVADNIEHAARRDPYREKQTGDGEDGSSVARFASGAYNVAPMFDDPTCVKLWAISTPKGGRPGELSALSDVSKRRALAIVGMLRIAADCAESGTIYVPQPPAAEPPPAEPVRSVFESPQALDRAAQRAQRRAEYRAQREKGPAPAPRLDDIMTAEEAAALRQRIAHEAELRAAGMAATRAPGQSADTPARLPPMLARHAQRTAWLRSRAIATPPENAEESADE